MCAERSEDLHALRIEPDVVRPLRGDIGIEEDRLDRTLGNTRPAIDTVIRVDVELLLIAIEAFTRANDHAVRVLASATRLGHYMAIGTPPFGSEEILL